MAFYQVTLNGINNQQRIANILWYRTAPLSEPVETLFDLQSALAAEVRDKIWLNGGVYPTAPNALRNFTITGYTLQSIFVNSWDDIFNPISSEPYTLEVNQAGLKSGNYGGPAPCAILHATTEPVAGPGIGLPRGGYLAIGPLLDTDVQDNGTLTTTAMSELTSCGVRLASDMVTVFPPATLYPIRTRVTRIAGVVTNISYRDVSAFTPRLRASFRRSRVAEA